MPKTRGRCDAAKQGWNTIRKRLNASDSGLNTSNEKAMIAAMEAVKSGHEMGANRAALEHGEEESKRKKREERERKRIIEKQEKKSRKAEIRQKKMAEKSTRKKQSKPTESGVQSNEISNNECALCFGLYEDDLSMIEKLGYNVLIQHVGNGSTLNA